MENLEQRVWGRVLGQPGEAMDDLGTLILTSQELATIYGHLAKSAGEKTKPLLKILHREELGILNTLKGISHLQNRQVHLRPLPPPKTPAVRQLETCYHRSLRARQEYMARSAGPEFGEVFRLLADRAGEQCARISEILGIL